MKRWWERLAYPIGLASAVLIAYGGVLSYAFLFDDEFLIQKNHFLDSFAALGMIFKSSSTAGAGFVDSFYRPLQISAYLLVQEIAGRETWAFHLLNISLHAANAVLIYLLGEKLGLKRGVAFLAALIWALHPIHTEAVTYMSATADPLHVLFILSGLLIMLPDFSPRRIGAGLIFFACALMSKESAIVFPGLVMTVLFLTREDRRNWRTYLPSLPAWGLAFLYLGLRRTVLNFNQDFTMYKQGNLYTENFIYRLETFLATLPNYLRLLIWPTDLHIDREFPVHVSFLDGEVLAGAGLVLLGAFCVVQALRDKRSFLWPAWIALWFAAAYGPQSGLLIPVNSLFLEHWMYLPSISLALGVTLFFSRFDLRAIVPASLVVAGGFAVRTFQQNRVWESPISLFSHILQFNPADERVRHNLAMAYSDAGENEKALEEYKFIIQKGGNYPQTFHNVAHIYFLQRRWAESEEYFLKALKLAPEFAPSYAGLAELYQATGNNAKAEEYKKKYREFIQSRAGGF